MRLFHYPTITRYEAKSSEAEQEPFEVRRIRQLASSNERLHAARVSEKPPVGNAPLVSCSKATRLPELSRP